MTDASLVRIYFDTNVFIELLERRTAITEELWRFFGQEAGRGHQIVTSELTLSELLVDAIDNALETGDYAKRDLFLDSIVTKGNEQLVVGVDRNILEKAALVRAQLPRLADRKIKLPDAIHLATALQMNCAVFITGDQRLIGAIQDIIDGKGLTEDAGNTSIHEVVNLNLSAISAFASRLGIQ